eukprot:Gb_39889 [translate_table: standard]
MIPIKLESSTAVDDWLSVAWIECSAFARGKPTGAWHATGSSSDAMATGDMEVDVAIAGGGLALAVGLHQRGIQAYVFEKAEALRTDSATAVSMALNAGTLVLEEAFNSANVEKAIEHAVHRFEQVRIDRVRKIHEFVRDLTDQKCFQSDLSGSLSPEEKAERVNEFIEWTCQYPHNINGDLLSTWWKP